MAGKQTVLVICAQLILNTPAEWMPPGLATLKTFGNLSEWQKYQQ